MLKEIMEKFGKLGICEKRSITDKYVELIFYMEELREWEIMLAAILGPPLKPAGTRPSMAHRRMTKNYGKITTDQVLFFKNFGNVVMIAMLWPWKDGAHVTLKMALSSKAAVPESREEKLLVKRDISAIKPGDMLLFKGEDGMSKIISWGTGSPYSHIAVCVSPHMNLAIEAIAGGGVRARDMRQITEAFDVYRISEKHPYNLSETISYLISKLNSSYDLWGVVFLGFLKIMAHIGLPFQKTANTWQKDRDYFCSELCYEAFRYGGGLDIVPDLPDTSVTSPGDIAESSVLSIVR